MKRVLKIAVAMLILGSSTAFAGGSIMCSFLNVSGGATIAGQCYAANSLVPYSVIFGAYQVYTQPYTTSPQQYQPVGSGVDGPFGANGYCFAPNAPYAPSPYVQMYDDQGANWATLGVADYIIIGLPGYPFLPIPQNRTLDTIGMCAYYCSC